MCHWWRVRSYRDFACSSDVAMEVGFEFFSDVGGSFLRAKNDVRIRVVNVCDVSFFQNVRLQYAAPSGLMLCGDPTQASRPGLTLYRPFRAEKGPIHPNLSR